MPAPTGGRFPAPSGPEGLSGAPGDLPLLGLSLAARQERAFVENGMRFVDGPATGAEAIGDVGGPRIVVREDVAVTAQAVAALAEIGRQRGRDSAWRGGGRAGELAREVALGDVGPWLVYLHGAGPLTSERLSGAEVVDVEPKERLVSMPVGAVDFGVDLIELPLSDRMVIPAGHWIQLLWANLLGLGPFLWRTLAGRNAAEMVWRLGWAVATARSTDPWRMGARLWKAGRGCRIHPSAVLEGCWLGDGVEIGANAVVRGSVLGDGVVVEDQALVEFSVLAAAARVQWQAMVRFAVACRAATAGGAVQLAVLDRQAVVEHGAVLTDIRAGQGVKVRRRGGMVAAPMGLAGACVGEGTRVGVGVRLAAGLVLPPGLVVSGGSGSLVSGVADGLRGTVAIRGGRLEPV